MQRAAYLAGQWYPGNQSDCQKAIEGHAADTCVEQGPWHGLIGPHAGWFFSGTPAARSYRWLAESQPSTDLVVVFGSHRGAAGPNSIFLADEWCTPLGPLQVASDLSGRLHQELSLSEEPVAPTHADNAVEVHLPFVRHFFPDAQLLMLGVAASERAIEIGAHVGAVCRGEGKRAVFVGSTDLTHYGPNYGFSPAGAPPAAHRWAIDINDRGFIEAVIARDPHTLLSHASEHRSACCPGAVAATLAAVESFEENPLRATPHVVQHSSSYDVRPDSSFVGYAGIVL